MANTKFTLIPTTIPSELSIGDIVILNSDGQAYLNDKPVARIAKQSEKQIVGYAKKSTAAWFDKSRVANAYAKIRVEEGALLGAEAYLTPIRQEKDSNNNVCEYKLGGLVSQNPKKTMLIQMINDNPNKKIALILTLFRFGTKDVVRANLPSYLASGDSCGEILDPDQDLIDFLNRNGSVTACTNGSIGTKKTVLVSVYLNERSSISQYYQLIDTVISRCIAQAPTIEEKIQFMVKNRFSDALIEAVANDMTEAKNQVPNPKIKYSQPKGNNLTDLVSYMLLGKMVRLVGEKGSGKNTLAETACWLLNRPLCRVQGSSELDKLDLLGSRTLKDGNTGFELSNMLEILRDGGTVVIDEANTVRPEVLTILHSLTDGARAIDVPGYGRVEMDKRACILYTMNEDYIGTGEMNAATVDRGPTMIIEQELNLSALLKEAVPNAKEADVQTCCKVSDEIHRIIDQGESEFGNEAVTIRGYIDALQMAMFIPLKRALIQNVANKAQSELDRKAIADVIDVMVG